MHARTRPPEASIPPQAIAVSLAAQVRQGPGGAQRQEAHIAKTLADLVRNGGGGVPLHKARFCRLAELCCARQLPEAAVAASHAPLPPPSGVAGHLFEDRAVQTVQQCCQLSPESISRFWTWHCKKVARSLESGLTQSPRGADGAKRDAAGIAKGDCGRSGSG